MELVVFDATGVEVKRTGDAKTLQDIMSIIESARNCKAWQWNEKGIRAKLSLRSKSGSEQRFVLMDKNQIIELGPEPDRACRTININDFLRKLGLTADLRATP